MAIKGLTDRGLSFPEIGQIRKGAKKDPNGNKPGADLTFFRVEFDEAEKDASAKFEKAYGDKPTEIRIVLPFNEIPRMWDAWIEAYTAGRMIARSDGEYFTFLVDYKTGEILVKGGIEIKTGLPKPFIPGAPLAYWKDKKGELQPVFAKPTGRLKVIIPELGRAAYLTVMTTSVHDIANISQQLAAFQTVNSGLIAGIPLMLKRRPKKISCPNQDGTRARRVKYMLSIEADPVWMNRMLGHLNSLALPGSGTEYAALPQGEIEEEVTPEVFDEPEDEIQDGEYQDTPPAPVATWAAVDAALALKTTKGAEFSTLTVEQLKMVCEKSPNPVLRNGACLLVGEPDKAQWDDYFDTAGRADKAGVVVKDVMNASAAELRKIVTTALAELAAKGQ